jgi:enamine deaminase RidA (YjgF/YER057c/UK114 family)
MRIAVFAPIRIHQCKIQRKDHATSPFSEQRLFVRVAVRFWDFPRSNPNDLAIQLDRRNFFMRRRAYIISAVLILIAFGFAPAQKESGRRYIHLPDAPSLPFSDGVLSGNALYLSGRLGIDSKTGKIPEDREQEIRIILNGMKATLEHAGMTMDHLVYVQVFCPDLSLYDQFNGIYRTYFGKEFPARAFIGSGPLLRGAHFEVQGIAVKESSQIP